MLELLSFFLGYLLIAVIVLVRVAFLVLYERKILGYIQIRRGPNRVGVAGVIQSFGDAIKLFIKEQFFPLSSNFFLYYLCPVFSLFLMLFLWVVIPYGSLTVRISMGGIFFFCCTRFGVYTLIGRGWSSNSNYALLGAIRGIAQTISYEVRIALIFLCIIFMVRKFSFYDICVSQLYVYFFFTFFFVFICWLTSSLAEINRTPFDFSEGESELVSGFNIEYGRGGFALLFLAEYGRIIFMRMLLIIIFFGGVVGRIFLYVGVGCFFCYSFIWVRGTLPRYRYDKLIYLTWKRFLPVALSLMSFYFGWILVL